MPDVTNPVDTVNVTDLFAKDPDTLAPEEFGRIIEFYRDQRAKFVEMEAAGGPKKAKAAAKKKAEQPEPTAESALDIQAGA